MRIGVNGLGRVGRTFLRVAADRELDVVAVNDLTDAATLAHLLAYDSTFGPWRREVEHHGDALVVGGRKIAVSAERDPARLRWDQHGVDVVVESTGRFRTREQAAAHLASGVRKVLISAPGKGVDATIVMGVNHETYDPERHHVVSNASCTTNCVAPMVDVLNRHFGLVRGFMTTIHGYTNDQVLLDAPHKDLRRARSAAVNMIPTSTGAAKSVGLVIPPTAGLLDGVAVRVPIEDGSLVDLTAILGEDVTVARVNEAFEHEAADRLAGYLRFTTAPLVSRDVVGDSASCVFDAALTQTAGALVKVFGWYDNEWGYVNRLADLCEHVMARMSD